MALLLKQAKFLEHKAHLALVLAQQESRGYCAQLEQIEQYRLDYSRQMTERGTQGLSANSFSYLNRFIFQLDETLAKQRQAAINFEDNIERCQEYWQQCRQETRSLDWLIKKRQKYAKIHAEKLEQKQMDEFAALSFIRQQRSLY